MTTTVEQPLVRLELDSRPETLTLVRAALGGMGEILSLDPELLDDVKTAVSEACNNVVMHAYDRATGPMTVCMLADRDSLEVVIRDRGVGIAEPAESEDVHGVGLPVIRALTREAHFRALPEGGTEVRMEFDAVRDGERLLRLPGETVADDAWTEERAGDAIASLSPVDVLGGVLGRLARALAARARFSLDRFSDVYLVTDGIAAHVQHAAAGRRIGFVISTRDRRLDLTIGPLRTGASSGLRRSDSIDDRSSAIAHLSDEVEVLPDGVGELLHVVMLDQRSASGAEPERQPA